MRKIKVQKLSKEAFEQFGVYYDMLNPKGSSMGDFFNDKLLFPTAGNVPMAFSPLLVHKEDPMIVKGGEYHNCTGEGILCLDDDIIIHVAPATPDPCPEKVEAFYVPKGTMVKLNIGTWHMAPWAAKKDIAHVIIALPQRTYKADCVVIDYAKKDWIQVEK